MNLTKTTLIALAACAAHAGHAARLDWSGSAAVETGPAAVVAETRLADGTTNAWTQADLVAALGLLNRKYRRDIATESGRRAWHGREVAQTPATNDAGRLVMRRAYADGFTFDDEARAPTPREAASNAVRRVRASLPTNGVPKGLALRRAQAAARAAPSETNVTVTVGESPVVQRRLRPVRDDYGNVTSRVPDGEAVPTPGAADERAEAARLPAR